jgi:hypothetical protein
MDLFKLYQSDDKKYTGELYDILDIKLRVFYDCCKKVGLQKDQYHDAFSAMLKDRASDFYYDSIMGKTTDFDIMVAMTRTHFETEENRQVYLTEWRESTLMKITASNPAKSKIECLQLLITKLRKVQRGLSQAYQADHNLRDALINACRGVEECRLALFNPAPTFEGVCDQLRSAIGTVARERESAQFNTQLDQEDNQAYDKEVYDQH